MRLDLAELARLGPAAFPQAAFVEVMDGDELLDCLLVSESAEPADVAVEAVEQLGWLWQTRSVASAVGVPSAWSAAASDRRPEPLAVVICTASRPAQLARCIESVLLQLGDDDELIVVDNSPSGSGRRVAARAGARWIHETRPGSSWARNRGFREADHDLVAYIDDDCVADRTWLAALRHPFANPAVDAVTAGVLAHRVDLAVPLVVDDRYPYLRGWARAPFYGTTGTPDSPYDAWRLGTGASMAWRRTTLEALGGFDAALGAGTPMGSGDELDLFRRALGAGATVIYEPQALVYHDHPETVRALRRTLIRYGLGAGAQAAKMLTEERQLRPLRILAREWRWNLRLASAEAGRAVLRRPRLPVAGLAAQPAAAALGAVRFLRYRSQIRRAAT
ncbi:MAG TPA: glycosyltransferase [Acidimicrobiales bacterium]